MRSLTAIILCLGLPILSVAATAKNAGAKPDPSASTGSVVLGDFEKLTWPHLTRSNEQAHSGRFAGKWSELEKHQAFKIPGIPRDWSKYDYLEFWLYSEKNNGQSMILLCSSDNREKPHLDYFYHNLNVDWQGWKHFKLDLKKDFTMSREPVGWQCIDYCMFSTSGWGHKQLPDTVLYFDDVRLVRNPLAVEAKFVTRAIRGNDLCEDWTLKITNRLDTPCNVVLKIPNVNPAVSVRNLPAEFRLPPNATLHKTVTLTMEAGIIEKQTPLTRNECTVAAVSQASPSCPQRLTLTVVAPLKPQTHPFLFGHASLYERALERARKNPWAQKQVADLRKEADRIIRTPIHIPDREGQWIFHYICKTCSTRLQYRDGKNRCEKCGKTYRGWPYDQVAAAMVHNDNWRAIRTLGLAYVFSKNEAYAQRAHDLLLKYAAGYADYPIHDNNGKNSSSGARVFSQTLDEAYRIIDPVWGYDLIYNSKAWKPGEREKVENDFFREAARVIMRNPRANDIDNWQTWKNAAAAAIGFCLQDRDLASTAIFGGNGFVFQLKNSIRPDGFWHEGTPAYHFYATNAMRWTAEAACSAGFEFWKNQKLISLFIAPLNYTFPDLSLPANNDSDAFSLLSQKNLYEHAYGKSGCAELLPVLTGGERSGIEALLWGEDNLSGATPPRARSAVFPDLGAAMLRSGKGEDQICAHVDYGPYGGMHGHPDKLSVILYGAGRLIAPDPGRLSYVDPRHRSWYRTTFAHNTVCVDEKSQSSTTGKLDYTLFSPELSAISVSADDAYPGIKYRRTVALTDGVMIDIFRVEAGEPHTYDWVWHNLGRMETTDFSWRAEKSLGNALGYCNVEEVKKAQEHPSTSVIGFKSGDGGTRLHLLDTSGGQLFSGMGLTDNPPKKCPLVMLRKKQNSACFIAVIEVYRKQEKLKRAVCLHQDQDVVALKLCFDDYDAVILFNRSGQEKTIGEIQTGARVFRRKTPPGKPLKTPDK